MRVLIDTNVVMDALEGGAGEVADSSVLCITPMTFCEMFQENV